MAKKLRKVSQEELTEILRKHKMWLNHEEGGKRANLSRCDLRGSDFSCCNISYCDISESDIRYCNIFESDLSYSNLRGSNLSYSDLSYSNLRGSLIKDCNFKGCNIDYNCLPLWCGSLSAHFDDRQLRQIAYHLVKAGLLSKNASAETKRELAKLIDFANGFHRVKECGKIEWEETEAEQ